MLTTDPTCRMILCCTVTFCTTDQGAVLSWLRGLNISAKPPCPEAQLFSIVLPSISTRSAFFNSIRFFTDQEDDIHASGLLIKLRRMVMLDGTRFGMPGSAPPNMMFSVVASR